MNNNDLRKLIDFRNILPVTIIRDIADYFYSVAVIQFEDFEDIDGCESNLNIINLRNILVFAKKAYKNKQSLIIFLLSEIVQDNIDIDYATSIYSEIKTWNIPLVEKIKQTYLCFRRSGCR